MSQSLRENLERMESDELVARLEVGAFTEEARAIALNILTQRGEPCEVLANPHITESHVFRKGQGRVVLLSIVGASLGGSAFFNTLFTVVFGYSMFKSPEPASRGAMIALGAGLLTAVLCAYGFWGIKRYCRRIEARYRA